MAGYRLGDMLAFRSFRYEICTRSECPNVRSARHNITFRDNFLALWPHSLASMYMNTTDDEMNFGVLVSLVDAWDSQIAPPSDAVVVHVRTGDVLEYCWFTVCPALAIETLLNLEYMVCTGIFAGAFGNMTTRSCYVKNLAYYAAQLSSLPRSVKRVVLVAASHYELRQTGFPRSTEYLRRLSDFFRGRGFIVDMRLGQPPDDDFVYMSRARYFIQSGGGFSILVSNVVLRLNGTVLNQSVPHRIISADTSRLLDHPPANSDDHV